MRERVTNEDRNRIIAEDLARIEAMTDEDIDLSDISEITDEQWSRAVRGRFSVPVTEQVTLDIDPGIVAWYRRGGKEPEAAINAALLDHVARQRRAS